MTTLACNMYTDHEYSVLLNEIELGYNLVQRFNIWKSRTIELYRFITWKQTNNIILFYIIDLY